MISNETSSGKYVIILPIYQWWYIKWWYIRMAKQHDPRSGYCRKHLFCRMLSFLLLSCWYLKNKNESMNPMFWMFKQHYFRYPVWFLYIPRCPLEKAQAEAVPLVKETAVCVHSTWEAWNNPWEIWLDFLPIGWKKSNFPLKPEEILVHLSLLVW